MRAMFCPEPTCCLRLSSPALWFRSSRRLQFSLQFPCSARNSVQPWLLRGSVSEQGIGLSWTIEGEAACARLSLSSSSWSLPWARSPFRKPPPRAAITAAGGGRGGGESMGSREHVFTHYQNPNKRYRKVLCTVNGTSGMVYDQDPRGWRRVPNCSGRYFFD
jgi:hypothetical protein